ncbi:glycosyltransferase [Mariprofundus aestuarium]|uniref:glycosyltransferase n=1 Tax=Mariprofundus aestuarium TaxID=1921086 RepID=UPI000C21D11F|nr:glycosyltransferase [Mariprofundus aestuarium]
MLEALQGADDVVFVLDDRMRLPDGVKLAGEVYRVKATLFSRLVFEWRLSNLILADTLLLCMGNLPPLFAHKGYQQVFVQNRYLIDEVSLGSFGLPVRIRLMIERWWLRSRSRYVSRFIVQTPTMKQLIRKSLYVDAEVFPFTAATAEVELPKADHRRRYDFLYVASGEPHKNHKRLIEAWTILAEKRIFPSLCLTLDAKRSPDLCTWISAEAEEYGLNVAIIGECSHDEVQRLYRQSAAVIYPSLFESFGLPLVEAATVGLPILASNSSYVTDVIWATDHFDALSSHSIADAVSRFSFQPASLSVDLLSAGEFLRQVFRRSEAD